MKALNIHQPWAELIIQGRKTIELRTRRTNHRGLLAIRSTKTVMDAFCRQVEIDPATLVTGAILGIVELVEVIEMTPERFQSLRAKHLSAGIAPGRRKWGWQLTNPRRLAQPIICSALPGMFTLPEEIASQIREQ